MKESLIGHYTLLEDARTGDSTTEHERDFTMEPSKLTDIIRGHIRNNGWKGKRCEIIIRPTSTKET